MGYDPPHRTSTASVIISVKIHGAEVSKRQRRVDQHMKASILDVQRAEAITQDQ